MEGDKKNGIRNKNIILSFVSSYIAIQQLTTSTTKIDGYKFTLIYVLIQWEKNTIIDCESKEKIFFH